MLKDFGFTRGKAVIRPACENGTCLPCAISMRIIAGRLGGTAGSGLCEGRKGEIGSHEPCWFSDILSQLVPTATLKGRKEISYQFYS